MIVSVQVKMLKVGRFICHRFGHWVQIVGYYRSEETGAVSVRWRCRFCDSVNCTEPHEIETAKSRQRWILTALFFIAIWVAVGLVA